MDWVLIMYLISDEIAVRPYTSEAQCIAAITELRGHEGGAVALESGEEVEIVWAVCAPAEIAGGAAGNAKAAP